MNDWFQDNASALPRSSGKRSDGAMPHGQGRASLRWGHRVARGFALLEAMLAVAIFALGILALGKCVTNCLDAERFKVQGALARRALENRVAEIESGARPLQDSEELAPAPFSGVTLKQRFTALSRQNEKNVEMTGLYAVTLEAIWRSGATRSRQLTFYVHPRNP